MNFVQSIIFFKYRSISIDMSFFFHFSQSRSPSETPIKVNESLCDTIDFLTLPLTTTLQTRTGIVEVSVCCMLHRNTNTILMALMLDLSAFPLFHYIPPIQSKKKATKNSEQAERLHVYPCEFLTVTLS